MVGIRTYEAYSADTEAMFCIAANFCYKNFYDFHNKHAFMHF